MSKIDELISELCPEGVNIFELGEVVRIRNGRDFKHLGTGTVPVYGSGGVMQHVSESFHEGPSVLIPRKGSLGNLFFVDIPFWTVDTIFYTEVGDALEPKYFFYFLKTKDLASMNFAGGVPSLTQTMLNKVSIPIPPLEVQREIVSILDKFTQLEAELEAELEARRSQYEHTRDQLLDFSGDLSSHPMRELIAEFCPNGVKSLSIAEIAEVGTGSSDKKDSAISGLFPLYVRSKNVEKSDTFEFDETAIIIPGEGGVGDIFHFATGKYALHQRAYRISPVDSRVDPKYLFYAFKVLFKDHISSKAVSATVTSIRKPMVTSFSVPIPPLEVQREIVSILDKLDALVNDLTFGLPAEIAARRKQYEYYRNKLLTFKELETA